MKILVASDLHGSKGAAEKLVSLDEKQNFDKVFLLGDIGYSGARNIPPIDYSPKELYENLLKIRDKLIVIRGNCDSRVDEFVLKTEFHDSLDFELGGKNFHLHHGDLYLESDFQLEDGSFYLYGHTHVPVVEKTENHITINPGSMSLPKENNKKTYCIIDLDSNKVQLFDMDDNLLKEIDI